MKKVFIPIIIGLILFFSLGPSPKAPQLNRGVTWKNIPDSLPALAQYLQEKEAAFPQIKANNEAKIVWADSLHPQKTPIVFMYVHGFSASQMEGDPIHRSIAKTFGANLLLARVAGHGFVTSDSVLQHVTADDYFESVENQLALAKKMGDQVIVLATSFGGALSLALAARHPEIKALLLYSPCIAIADPAAVLMDNPWGLQIARKVVGGNYRDIPAQNADHDKYWNLHYRLEGAVELQNFLTHQMKKEVFEQVKCPVFMGYYYQDEAHQDPVVSVKAMKDMFPLLGTSASQKKEMAFPLSENHVITSTILAKRTDLPLQASIQFLKEVVHLP
ncbi:alpha/beta hydrolase [Aquirufa rosea]|uniref:Alpha/beta fold hydrolase n=1 Tax=Aquirufa rosea TaxID=2509241 RepID=A0A4Q1C1E7_9BACT|nr:alpha/beta fold hydrolase [Aquirufa rosea]RXK50928.1 alpha/beta fold hydrolase [Aquirufa rosea]